MEIKAYFEEWSLRPGSRARLAVSTPHNSVRAVMERLIGGPGSKDDMRVETEDLRKHLDRTFAGRQQPIAVGSYAILPLPRELPEEATIHCWVWPTLVERSHPQTIWLVGSLRLSLVDGRFRLSDSAVPDKGLEVPLPVVAKRWYSVVVHVGRSGLRLDVALHDRLAPNGRSASQRAGKTALSGDNLYVAAAGVDSVGSPIEPFNGKIEAPSLYHGGVEERETRDLHLDNDTKLKKFTGWNFHGNWTSETITNNVGNAPDGALYNGSERAVTSHNWTSASDSFLVVPEEYNALQFHEDDMVDAGWEYDLEFDLPADLRSGVYCVRLEAGGATNRIPFFVTAPQEAKAPVLFLVPTNTYLAYANDHMAALDFSSVIPHEKTVPDDEKELFENPGLGRSVYDTHSDGTPVRYSSRRRPLVNVRPAFQSWITGSYRHFAADLYLIEWLERSGISYHVATDEDLDREGRDLLSRYKVVLTGSHPEYWSGGALDTLRSFLANSGRLMYLGGNGFYWVTTRFPNKPWVIEVRRDNTGTRCWSAPYGERGHAATGEPGGLWRLRGRAPNKTVGIGFVSEGWGPASHYRRLPASYSGEGKVFFEGIESEVFGTEGHVLGGAAGDEVDRFDITLGSPAHAEVLATSTPLGREYQLAIEDQTLTLPDQDGVHRPDVVRSDVVYFRTAGGGAVFSIGSISCAGAMAWNEFDNDLARLTTNVLRNFAGEWWA